MATIKCILQSKSETANIYIQFSIGRGKVYKRKSGFVVNAKHWSVSSGQPLQNNDGNKALKSKLDKLSTFIIDAYNLAINNSETINNEWLQLQIDLFNNKAPVTSLDILTNYIEKYIEEAPFKPNGKKSTGLSTGRVNNLRLFFNTIKRFEAETMKGKEVLIKDINLKFAEEYKNWLFQKKYSINYIGKNIANLKTICFDAEKNGIETSTQYKSIKTLKETKAPEQVVYLSEEEQEAIKNTILKRESLINARKWLLLGCLIGQRGGDLLNITEKNIKEINGVKIIELKQQKTGKLVAIPLLPEALEIIESGFPYKISLPRFNEYIKDICKETKLNEPITGRKKEKSSQPNTIGTFPKYEMVTSHVCRRSFATNYYGRIPTPVLMNITAHGTEKVFLNYIGKTTYDNAFQMVEYFSKLTPKEKTPQLEVVHSTGTN